MTVDELIEMLQGIPEDRRKLQVTGDQIHWGEGEVRLITGWTLDESGWGGNRDADGRNQPGPPTIYLDTE